MIPGNSSDEMALLVGRTAVISRDQRATSGFLIFSQLICGLLPSDLLPDSPDGCGLELLGWARVRALFRNQRDRQHRLRRRLAQFGAADAAVDAERTVAERARRLLQEVFAGDARHALQL